MKRKNFLYALLALSVLGVSCSRTDLTPALQVSGEAPKDPYTVPFKWWALESLQTREAPQGERTTLTAQFSEAARSYLDMNDEETEAAVIWSPGDSFTMYGFDGYVYDATYTTEEGGAAAAFSSTGVVPTPCYSMVPESNKFATYGNYKVFEITVPNLQTAIEGNIAPGINAAYAYSESQDAPLRFHNLLSLVRFRLSGGIAGEVRQVTLRSSYVLSGDIIVLADGDDAEFNTDLVFDGSEHYSTVTLSGDFRAGADYYIATVPAAGQLVTMAFSNSEGETITRYGSNPVDFRQGRICDLGTIALGDSFEEESSILSPVCYMTSSKARPVTLAVIPDGFTLDELATYEAKAKIGINALFATEPYKTYKDYFNVWILKVPSAESGAGITDGKGNVITPRNTYFSTAWGSESYGDMSSDYGRVFSFVSQNCPDITDGLHTIDEVPVLLLINEDRYGGICQSWSNGQCISMVPTVSIPLAWGYPDSCAVSNSDPSLGLRKVTDEEYAELGRNSGDWRNIVVHEFGGHGIGRLTDEYWYGTDRGAIGAISGHSLDVPMGLNISAHYSPTPWDDEVLSRRDALVAQNPLYSRIGVFQGGEVSKLHRWRSEKISCMIDNRFFFSTWQRMLIVKRILSLAGEAFDVDEFYAKDHPEDPVRDVVSSPVMGKPSPIAPVHVPPLPPVRIMDN